MRTSHHRDETFFYLEDLQDLGERYLPSVLNEFFTNRGFGQVARTRQQLAFLDEYIAPIESQLVLLKRLLFGYFITYNCLLIFATVTFWFSSCWNREDTIDPIHSKERIEAGLPSIATVLVVICTIVSGFVAEIYTCTGIVANPKDIFSCKKNYLIMVSSLMSQTSAVMDVMSMVVLIRGSGSHLLLFVSSSVFLVYVILMGVMVPLRILMNDPLTTTATSTLNGTTRFSAIGWPESSSRRQCERATNIDPNTNFLLSISFGSVALNWRLLDALVRTRLGNILSESAFLLQSIVMGYLSCFSFQLIQIPLKVFFLLDYGYNEIVFYSIPFTLVGTLLVCLTNVFPLEQPHPRQLDNDV